MDHLWRPVLAQAAVKLQALGITTVPVGRSDVRLCDGSQLHESDGPRGALSDSTSASAMAGWWSGRAEADRMTENRTSFRRAGKIARAQQGGAVGGGLVCDSKTNVRRGGIEQESGHKRIFTLHGGWWCERGKLR